MLMCKIIQEAITMPEVSIGFQWMLVVLPVQPNTRRVHGSMPNKRIDQAGVLRGAPGVGEPLQRALTARHGRLVLHTLRLTEGRCALVEGGLHSPDPLSFFMKAKSPVSWSPWTSCLCFTEALFQLSCSSTPS